MSYWDAFSSLVSDLYEVKTLDMNTVSGPLIKFGTKILSNEEPSTASNVSRNEEPSIAQNNAEMSIILARKCLPLFKVRQFLFLTYAGSFIHSFILFFFLFWYAQFIIHFLYLFRFPSLFQFIILCLDKYLRESKLLFNCRLP